jgi:glycine/D-amino acid oxidase-like deaminating enzyme
MRDHEVTLLEQFPLEHDKGSSHGRTRIIRRAYPDPFYTKCMEEAFPLWRQLEAEASVKLIHEVGLFYFGPSEAPDMGSTIAGLRDLNVPFELVDASTVHRFMPNLQMEREESGIYTPEAGWIDAALAMRSLLDLVVGLGVQVVSARATLEQLSNFDHAVVTAGAWIHDWWPGAPVKVTLQSFGYLNLKQEGPVWIEEGKNLVYGFPSDKHGLKAGIHRAGRTINPRDGNRDPDLNDLETIREFARRRFGADGGQVIEPRGCLYTSTASEDFLIHQPNEKVLVASACSGHGFKFGPWFGKLLADLVEGRTTLNQYPRFSGLAGSGTL